ncbi:hypothetical protein VB773_02365 [Haloarculaceae archaeon H-GB2-1]|nr:hypothetical protein [Haloarculaceae archaeon H-GB1-1]MEA5388506.1 hypothetical protein [Haloarculaceae archaeon H-GB11]MEA5406536.1 hypothetical protein [Haloarculaceae archaeon H-GB2-1]
MYESGLIAGISEHVDEGDDVVIVGGGRGITAVRAAEQVGETGTVTVFEGASECIGRIKQTARLNSVADRIAVYHRIVGSTENLKGSRKGAARLSPSELPECDVLELDCEGAEIEILDGIEFRPRVVLVETHGLYDTPSEAVKTMLENQSYSITSEQVADEGRSDFCEDNDIMVIAAVRQP